MKTVTVPPTAELGKSRPKVMRQRARATVAAGFLLAAVVGWLSLEIPRGTLWATDELLTAERTREMLSTGPWVVSYNFQDSFEKPPLQYWLSMLTLPRLQNRAVAVRVWPLFYATLTLAALGWLVFLVEPNRPWLVPLSIALLSSSPLFSPEACRALLDIGLAFFTVATIVFAHLARKRPSWWLVVAAACWLGSLQKIPLPFLVWVLIVLARLISPAERRQLRSGWFAASMLLAIAAMSIWPLIQLLKYQMPVQQLFNQEVIDWLGPENLGARSYFEIPRGLSTTGGASGFFGLLALFVILFSKKQSASGAVREIAMVSLSVIVLAVVFNFRDVRYMVPIVPLLCFLLALVLHNLLERRRPVRIWATCGLVVLLAAGFVQAKIRIEQRRKNVADEKMIAEKLGALQQPGAATVLIKAIKPGNDLLWDSFYLFHGNFRYPVAKYTVDEIRNDPPRPPVVGACITRDFPVVQQVYPNVQVQFEHAQFICWQAPTP